MKAKRVFVLALVGALVAAWFVFDLGRFVTLEQARNARDTLLAWREARPIATAAGYFVAYVVIAALSLPGATVLTLLGGAVFGLGWATLLVSFASTLGATLAMLAARTLLRDTVQARFGPRLAEVDRGIARDGAFYLVSLRLVPLLPFFVVNLLMGLTAIRVPAYWLASQLGMLPGTLVYVNAGTQLAQLQSAADVLSAPLVGAFVLLALFPLLAKFALDAWRRREVYRPWAARRPKRYDRNLVVIGAGSAGLVTSYIAAAVKAKVTLVESHRMGGDCLNTGCVPSKALIRAATLAQGAREAAAHGVHVGEVRVDFAAVMAGVHAAVTSIAPHDSVERYTGLGVEVLQGHATIVDPWRVRVRGDDGREQTLSTRAIVVATGARPVVPPLPGFDGDDVLTSETLWSLRELPRRLVVLGGGPIGCELAQAFARLGAQVVLVELAPRLLAREDDDVAALVLRALRSDGVDVRLGRRALRIERGGALPELVVAHDGGEERLPFDRLLCAVGRRARLEGFGLEALGIDLAKGLPVDAALRTRFPNILACGDVVGPLQFTHAAAHQAWTAAVNGLFGGLRTFQADLSLIPAVTFVDPEVARIGLNRREAQAQGVKFESTRFELHELDRALTDRATEGWVEVLTAPGRDRLLGATIVGREAGELIAEFALAMKHRIGLNGLLGTVHAYPTRAEANKYAAGAWRRAHQPEALLRWVERFHAWRRG